MPRHLLCLPTSANDRRDDADSVHSDPPIFGRMLSPTPIAASLLIFALGALVLSGCSTVAPAGGDDVPTAVANDVTDTGTIDTVEPDDTKTEDTSTATDAGTCKVDDDCTDKVKLESSCFAAVCDSGFCVAKQKSANAACDDGQTCTTSDVCDAAGTCSGKIDCPAATCFEAVCKADGSCGSTAIAAAVKAKCDDGNACTVDDDCGFGECAGDAINVAKVCDDGKDCTDDSCSNDKGCENKPKKEKTPCSDDDACTDNDGCDTNGGCISGKKVVCDDKDLCTKDICDVKKGCLFPIQQTGVVCDDNNKCTDNDECTGGGCKGKTIDAALPPNDCVLVQCDPATQKITKTSAANGKPCSDDDTCTVNDACDKGICKGKALVCNDGNSCTADACDKKTGTCVAPAQKDGSPCTDGDKCTTKDACVKGKCTGELYTTTAQCDDKSPCTNDGCSPQSGCFHVPKNGAFCDDGNKCTELDRCTSGKCAGTKTPCNDNKPCTNDSCDEKTGKCLNTAFTGPCDDGNKCTASDSCTKGKCDGKTVTCDDNNTCTTDVCDTVSGCKYIPLAGGSTCDDGVSCTLNDQCDLGKCTGTNTCVKCSSDLQCTKYDDNNPCNGVARCSNSKLGKVCQIDPKSVVTCGAADDPACGTNQCNPQSGKCELLKKQKGVQCVSNDKCLAGTTCSDAGRCEGTAKDCDDNEVCTVDSCDPKVGCKNAAKKDGDTCDDGSVCTVGEACQSGKCSSDPKQNKCACAQDNECTKFEDGDLCNGVFKCIDKLCVVAPNSRVTCDPSKASCAENLCVKKTGKCVLAPKKDGLVCDDGSKCTIQDACKGGQCLTNAKLDCDDGSPCTVDACGPLAGCVHGNVGEGGFCNDGNPCTDSDRCKQGKCAGAKKSCDDDNPCTIDLCSSKTGKCTALLDNKLLCTDGDPCTIGDKCQDGVCKAAALKCDDGNPCTVDGCNGKGGCLNKIEFKKDCDDGNACTALDTCNIAGTCLGTKKDCNDGSACTQDSCVKGACVITAAVGKLCNDGNKCTSGDACNNKGACEAKLVDCDDGNVCTKIAGPCSPVNGCTIVPNDGKNCNDGDACTYLDKCKTGACDGTAVNCNDNNVCTIDNCNKKTGCENKQNTCDDNNDCTFDKCDNKKGCLYSNLDGFQPCDDGDVCTDKGVCNKGKCEATLKNCDDKNVCTTDKCAPASKTDKGGCVNLPVEDTATLCDDGKACTKDNCDGKGKCKSVPLDCNDGSACTLDACITGKGCQYTDKKDGADCDDDDVCSTSSVCQGGFCIAAGQNLCPTCKNNDDCKLLDNNDLCDGKWECIKKKATDISGRCIEDKTVVTCDTTGDSACSKNTCVTTTGVCAAKELVNGTTCDDDQPCTVGDVCTNGQCLSAGSVDCSSVADSCNGSTCLIDSGAQNGYSCVQLPKAGTIVCDADGDPCTAGDTCDNGSCKVGKPISCDSVAGECELAACVKDKAGGFTCKISQAKDGDACQDDQLCTVGDACKAGKCQAGTGPYDCSGDVDAACATGVCDKANNGGRGGCTAKPKNNGGVCNADDNGCTAKDICAQGTCVPGVPPDCNSKTGSCTVGACKSTGKTSFTCIAAPIKESKPCEADKNGCTIDDKCLSGKCVPGKMKDCSSLDGSAGCQIGVCEPLSSSAGKCVGKPAKSGIPCDADSNGCTKDDICNGKGACQPGTAVNCLKETSGCGQGTCSSLSATSFKCATDAKPKGTKCDADADGCTVDDTCDGSGKCVAGKAPDCSKFDKGACIVGGCTNKGSVNYLCEAYPQKNGDPCNADKNGCTVNDSCKLGFCNVGVLETCSKLQGKCVTAACVDTDGSAFKCKITPVDSWPALAVDRVCDPKAKSGDKLACATGYKCIKTDPAATSSVCVPQATVNCADGDKCVESASCVGGICKAQAMKDCDDEEPCTLDSCKAGACSNTKIVGCGACLTEGFEKAPFIGLLLRTTGSQIKFAAVTGEAATGTFVLAATWDGTKDAKATAAVVELEASLILRKMYLEDLSAQTFSFNFKAVAQTVDCVEMFVNGTSAWKKCGAFSGATTKGYGLISIDLSAYAGQSVDMVLKVTVPYDKKAKGEVRIDDVKLSGRCVKGCMGTDLEVPKIGPTLQPKEKAIPQPWRLASDAINFVSWKMNDKDGRSGKGSLRAAWTGGSPDGKAYGARITIPRVTVLKGTKLHFAIRAKTIGEAGCSGDTFTVSIDGKALNQVCDSIQQWRSVTVDLQAYVGKSVDITLTALAGKTKSAAGSFELDDVAITGDCSYLCYNETFDGSLGSLKNASQGQKNYSWLYQTGVTKSKPGAASITYTKSLAVGTNSFLTPAETDRVFLKIPVMGASFDLAINAFLSKKATTCPKDVETKLTTLANLPFVFGLLAETIISPELPKKQQGISALVTLCESSSGFGNRTGPLPEKLKGLAVQPFFISNRLKGIDEAKFYVDDIRIICK